MNKNKVTSVKEEELQAKKDELVNITIIDQKGDRHDVDVPLGLNLTILEISQSSGLPVEGTCGGIALCASCHCFVESKHALPEPSDEELDMLDTSPYSEDNSRLGCQIRIDESLDGLVVTLAPTGEED